MNTIQFTVQDTQDPATKQVTLIIDGIHYPLNASVPVLNRLVSDEVVLEVIDETISHTTPVYNTVIEQ